MINKNDKHAFSINFRFKVHFNILLGEFDKILDIIMFGVLY